MKTIEERLFHVAATVDVLLDLVLQLYATHPHKEKVKALFSQSTERIDALSLFEALSDSALAEFKDARQTILALLATY